MTLFITCTKTGDIRRIHRTSSNLCPLTNNSKTALFSFTMQRYYIHTNALFVILLYLALSFNQCSSMHQDHHQKRHRCPGRSNLLHLAHNYHCSFHRCAHLLHRNNRLPYFISFGFLMQRYETYTNSLFVIFVELYISCIFVILCCTLSMIHRGDSTTKFSAYEVSSRISS